MPKESNYETIKQDLSKKIPEALINILDSEDTASRISEICFENGLLKEENVEEVGYRVGLVLLGQLPPKNLPSRLEKQLKITDETAQKIYNRISEAIFLRVKDDLSELYQMKPAPKPEKERPPEEPSKPPKKDVYHEPIE